MSNLKLSRPGVWKHLKFFSVLSTRKLQTDLNLHNFVAKKFLFREEDK